MGEPESAEEPSVAKETRADGAINMTAVVTLVVLVVGALGLFFLFGATSAQPTTLCPGSPKVKYTKYETAKSFEQWLVHLASELKDITLKAQTTYIYDFEINKPRSGADNYDALEFWVHGDGNQTDSLDSVDENTTYYANDTNGFALTSVYPIDKLGGKGLGYSYKAGDFGWESHHSDSEYYDGPQVPERLDALEADRFSNETTKFHRFFRLTLQGGEICKDVRVHAHVEHQGNKDKAETEQKAKEEAEEEEDSEGEEDEDEDSGEEDDDEEEDERRRRAAPTPTD